ncbi:phage portal protein [Hansschlegelia zhihuaiae]|uniref:Phage portal protein n=2 Tax=Hansschlegelia zhihuaiae TaxID=405005 RepID=A0A4Q0MFX2_9HYPH|nr:phage portal protein [Hansschlegelia zhihuaiae]
MSLAGPSGLCGLRIAMSATKPRIRVAAGSRPMAAASRSAHQSADLGAQAVAGWVPPLLSPDAEWLYERDLSVARIRDLVRNDGWAQAAVDRMVDMTVGATFRLSAKPDAASLGISQAEADALALRIEARWRKYANDPTFRADAERALPVVGLFGLAARELVATGEACAVLRWLPKAGWPFATALQMVDADRLSNPHGAPDDETIRGGVECDANGAAVAYHFRDGHPSDWFASAKSQAWTRIERFERLGDWERPKVLHLFEKRRPGQRRGVSRLTAALVKQRLLAKYSEAEVKAAALNGSIVGAIYTQMGSEYAAEALGSTDGQQDWGAFNAARTDFYGERRLMDEARFVTMFPSDRLDLNSTPRQVSGYPAFQKAFLQGFAASLGISYEQLSMDWTSTNYSSARAALNETWRTIQRLRAVIVWGFVHPFYAAWLEDAIDTGEVELPAGAPDFYDEPAAYAQAEWVGPGRGYVDPVKEAQAAILRIRGRISTYEREAAEQGGDWMLNLQQAAREEAAFRDANVALPDDTVAAPSAPARETTDADQDEDDSKQREAA